MIDLQHETLITLAEAARLIPPARRGKKCAISTVFRWITSGAKAPDGTAVRLEAVRRPGAWLTSREAVGRFLAALTPDLTGERPKPPRSRAARQRALDKADKELARIGI